MKRKICIITGTRAEYDLLYWLMKEIQTDSDLELQIIVTGTHLSPEFGLTFKTIEDDGFVINEKVEMLLSSDTPVGIAKSIGLGTIGFADALNRLKPDILVVLGDRYEILAAVQAALIARIPVAHLHGGEVTEGVIDEAIRHAVTKMSHIHFVAAEPYRRRVIQLGENPDRVFNFGALGSDNIMKSKLLNRNEFEKSVNFKLGELNFLVTYHPVTLQKDGPEKSLKALFDALDQFPNARVIITWPNADTNGRVIIRLIQKYASERPQRVLACTSLGRQRYLSAVRHVDVVIGNSSSGLIEVPFLKKPTVNIGDRQRGRLRASSVIDCGETTDEIANAIRKALSPEFQSTLATVKSPYGEGNTAVQIKGYLKTVDLENIIIKTFYDLYQ